MIKKSYQHLDSFYPTGPPDELCLQTVHITPTGRENAQQGGLSRCTTSAVPTDGMYPGYGRRSEAYVANLRTAM